MSYIIDRIANSLYLWYYLFKEMYPNWSYNIGFGYNKQPLIDWKKYLIQLSKQSRDINIEPMSFKGHQLQEPFVFDVNPMTHEGIIGLSIHTVDEYKILFFNYPSYELIREYKIQRHHQHHNLLSYQLMGIQTIRYKQQSVRLFCVVVSRSAVFEEDDDDIDRLNIWQSVIIYTLHDSGHIECLANVDNLDEYQFMGRDVFFFSASDTNIQVDKWLNVLNKPHHPDNIYMLAFGPSLRLNVGYGHIIQFNLDEPIQDPLFSSSSSTMTTQTNTAVLLYTVRLGVRVSCMIHFRHYSQLNHLVCTGHFDSNELNIYDWRFGVKVGSVPWANHAQPWGFESTWVVLPQSDHCQDLSVYGLRLVAVGDIQQDNSFEIRLLDISHLLKVDWDPFRYDQDEQVDEQQDMPYLYSWWNHKHTEGLRRIVLGNILPYDSNASVLCVHRLDRKVEYTAYNILQTSLYLLTNTGQLIIMDIESGQFLKTIDIGSSVDINVLGLKDVVITKRFGLLKIKHQ